MSQNFDVVCIGNAKIDEFLTIHEAASHLRLDQETNELCLKNGEKIPVDNIELCLGGNAANVSVGLSRLGITSSLISEIGTDEFSQKIISTLKSENVDTTFIKQTPKEKNSISIILSFKNERTILSQHIRRTHDFIFDDISTKWVYLSSLGEEWENAYQKVYAFVKGKSIKLAFNPGTIQIDSGYEKIKNVLELTNILFLNKEEAIKIANGKLQIANDDIEQLLSVLQKLGSKNVVITDGENGSHAVNEKGEFFVQEIIKTNIVEKTGAGDAYASGFLAAFILNYSFPDSMKWGTLNAASNMQKVGAQNGILYRAEMETKLNAQ